jgi:hypothetical protein
VAGIFVTGLLLFAAVYATVRSSSLRFWSGTIAGILRALLVLAGGAIGAVVLFDSRPPSSLTILAVALGILGPVLSFTMVFVIFTMKANVPAREEERPNSLLMAWLPVALLDAVLILVALTGLALSRGP